MTDALCEDCSGHPPGKERVLEPHGDIEDGVPGTEPENIVVVRCTDSGGLVSPRTPVPSTGKKVTWLLTGAVGALLCFVATAAFAQTPAGQSRGIATRMQGAVKVDFDGLVERRAIRVAAPYSRTLYFNDRGRERGLDPDQWLNKLATAEKIGSETTTYVRNIYKYYVAYKLMLEVQEAQEKARGAVKPEG
jgi:hypothetical protein